MITTDFSVEKNNNIVLEIDSTGYLILRDSYGNTFGGSLCFDSTYGTRLFTRYGGELVNSIGGNDTLVIKANEIESHVPVWAPSYNGYSIENLVQRIETLERKITSVMTSPMVHSSKPQNPVQGDVYCDTSAGFVYVWDGNDWAEIWTSPTYTPNTPNSPSSNGPTSSDPLNQRSDSKTNSSPTDADIKNKSDAYDKAMGIIK